MKLLFVVFVILAGILLAEPYRMRWVDLRIKVPRLPQGLKVLFLSDLQLTGKAGYREKWILEQLPKRKFDLICITGDIFNTEKGMHAAVGFLQDVAKYAPTYVALGNWEHWSKVDLGLYRNELSRCGIHLLVNGSENFEWNSHQAFIVGVDDPSELRDDFTSALQKANPDSPKILLAHAPGIFPKAAERGIDLILSGHTHGGQVRLPLLGPIYLPPGCGSFVYGAYQLEKSILVVTSGIGTSVLPVRLLCRPEVVLIEVRNT